MQAWKHRFTLIAVVAVTFGAACAGNSEKAREEAAASEFRQRLAKNRADLIYETSSEYLRHKMTEAEFRKALFSTQVLGVLEQTERAHFTHTPVTGEPDLVVTFYNSRFTKGSCLESFSWRVEQGALKLATYSCAPNMQVTCSAETKCETSPVPPPGIAGD
jgi:hypothetical protein